MTQAGWAETTGALAAYPLNDDNAAQATDTSGNNNTIQANPANGTVTGTMTAITPVDDTTRGWVDQFNGTGSSITTTGPLLNTAGSFTVAAWVKLSSTTRNAVVIAQDGISESGFYLGYFGSGDWELYFMAADTTNPAWQPRASAAGATTNWTHLVGTYDASSKTAALYVNGSLASTATGVTTWNATGAFTVGRDLYNGTKADYFPGQISDVQAYNYAMTSYQIANLYQAHTPATSLG